MTHCTVLSHDGAVHGELGYSRVAKVSIGDHCIIGMNSTVLCGVTIGDHVIIGAGSVVTRDIPADSVAAGVPAKVIGTYHDYIEKNKALLEQEDSYISRVIFSEKTDRDKAELVAAVTAGRAAFEL